jgi:ATP synthase protein I
MAETNELKDEERREFAAKIGRKEARRARARQSKESGVWFGLGMMGTIGWSVAIPTLIGIAIGIWLDINYPGQISWTITLLFIGLGVGCANAWYWVKREQGRIEEDRVDE